MSDWLDDLGGDTLAGACVLVSVTHTRGSCPRDAGTRMLVTSDTSHGTIGGGHLEYQAIGVARRLLAASTTPRAPRLERFALGARLGQCCGGMVQLSFEQVAAERPAWVAQLLALRREGRPAVIVTRIESTPEPSAAPTAAPTAEPLADATEPTRRSAQVAHRDVKRIVALSPDGKPAPGPAERGAHVSPGEQWRQAERRAGELLSESSGPATCWEPPFLYEPFVAERFDIRLFGAGHVGRALIDVLHPLPCSITWIDSRESPFPDVCPDNVCLVSSERPEEEVEEAPPGSYLIVMTHSHALDQAICERALRRADIAWCGLIGSMTKRRQFEKRLLARGIETGDLARLVCPIGLDGISGKHPAEIAIAVAADVLRVREGRQATARPAHQAA